MKKSILPFVHAGLAIQGALSCPGAEGYLTPEGLAMPRQQISRSLNAPAIRLCNDRGYVVMREMSVTGIGKLGFPPILSDPYRFNLAFREEASGVLVQDIQDEVGDPLYCNQAPSLDSKLGPSGSDLSFNGRPAVLLSQEATWQPNRYTCSGTFHKIVKDRMVSFGVESRICMAADADEIYEEFEIENRLDRPLVLTVIPDQHDTPRVPCFVRKISNGHQVTAVSDLGAAGPEGWRMEIPANGKKTARVGLLVQKAGEPAPAGYHVADLAARVEKSQRGTRELLKWASQQLPRVSTQNKPLDEFYQRSILTVLNCRLNRPDCISQPFYETGPGQGLAWLWDASFVSEMLAVLDPVGLKQTIRMFLHCGQGTRVAWNSALGNAVDMDDSGYGQNPFAMLRLVSAYILLTGDTAFLDETVDGTSVLQLLKLRAANMDQRYARPDGLLDFGGGTGKWLEIRTSGYEHVVAAANGMAANLYLQVAHWCRDRNDPDATRFQTRAETISARLDDTLWNQEAGWYENHYPDGSRHLVINYHQFDLLDLPAIPLAKKQRMIGRIREGEFLGPYGMFSMARSDRAHWDREDCDFGGGGQYVGYPLRIAESLYRMNEPAKAWDVLSRCVRWVERFPYFPQSTYADNLILQPHQQDWPLNISGGGGVQAVVFGLFGIRPGMDGSLEVAPCHNPSLGEAKLTGFRFRGHVYDVAMNATKFGVSCDGKKVAEMGYQHGSVVRIPATKETSSGMDPTKPTKQPPSP